MPNAKYVILILLNYLMQHFSSLGTVLILLFRPPSGPKVFFADTVLELGSRSHFNKYVSDQLLRRNVDEKDLPLVDQILEPEKTNLDVLGSLKRTVPLLQ